MRAKVVRPFIDKKEGVVRNVDDTLDLSRERLEEINSTKFGELAVAVAEEAATPKKATKKKG